MFIKLTQLNGKPIWFNQQYIVTVEPRKGPGALVVPLGDGLDYEVVESPDAIIEAMGGSMSPAGKQNPGATMPPKPADIKPVKTEETDFRIESGLIVPVQAEPQQDDLEDKAADADTDAKPVPAKKEEAPKKTSAAKRPRKAAVSPAAAAATKTVNEEPAGKAPSAKAPSAKGKADKKAKGTTRKTATAGKKAALPPLPLTEEQLTRLQKMSPGSIRKLVNTLMSQFAVVETAAVIDALRTREIITVTDQGHVDWNWRSGVSDGAAK